MIDFDLDAADFSGGQTGFVLEVELGGVPGEKGDKGDKGDAGTVDLTGYYTKTESDSLLALKEAAGAADSAVAAHVLLVPHLTPAAAASAAPVQSVAGKTGDVTLEIADVPGLQTALDSKAASTHHHDSAYEPKNTNLQSHIAATTNPHTVTAAQVGAYTANQVDTLLTGKASVSHSHVAAAISDFAEAVDDRVAALVVGGANITATYNDVANTLTIAATGGGAADHGDLSGLADDDHPQYLTQARADARYPTITNLQSALDVKADTGHTHAGLLPAGGTAGQVLTKTGGADYAAGWQSPAAGGGGPSLALSSTQLTGGAASIKLALAAASITGSVRLVRWRGGVSYEMLQSVDYKLQDAQSVLLRLGTSSDDVVLAQYWAAQASTPAATAFAALSSAVTWNPSDKAASIVLSGNNTLASQSGSRCSVRATQAITVPSYWETVSFFSPSGVDLVAGIALAAMPLTDWLGQTAQSASGPYASSGRCYYGGSIVATMTPLVSGQRIGHAYHPGTGVYKVTLDGTTWVTVSTGLSGTFYPAATVAAAAQSLLAVFNPADMWWTPPAGHTAGVA